MQTMEVKERAVSGQDSSSMGILYVTSFCCCMGLETGARVIGLAHLVASFSLMVVSATFARRVHALVDTVEDAGDHLYTTWYRIACGVTAVAVLHVLLAATLIYASLRRNMAALRAWLWAMCALYAAALLYCVAGAAYFGLSSTGSDIFVAFLEALVFFVFVGYCMLTVYSYLLLLRSCEELEPASPGKLDY